MMIKRISYQLFKFTITLFILLIILNGSSYGREANPPIQKDTPVVAQKDTPVVAQKDTPVVAQKDTPVVAQKDTPVVAQKDTPVVAQKDTPVVAQKDTPVVAQKDTPVVAKKGTPVVAQKDTPVVAQKDTPVVAQKDTPVVAKKNINNTEIPFFEKNLIKIVLDTVKTTGDTAINVFVKVNANPTQEEKYWVKDLRGGDLDASEYVFDSTLVVFSPGGALKQVVPIKIKNGAPYYKNVVLNLTDTQNRVISNMVITIAPPVYIFKTLNLSVGGTVDVSSPIKLDGVAVDLRVFAPDLSYDTIFYNFLGFGFEAGAYSYNTPSYNNPPTSKYVNTQLPYSQTYSQNGIINRNVDTPRMQTFLRDSGVYTLNTTRSVKGTYFSPYLKIHEFAHGENAIKISLYYSPRFEFETSMYTNTVSNITPQFRDTIKILDDVKSTVVPNLNMAPHDTTILIYSGYIGILGFTLHAMWDKYLDFHISPTYGVSTSSVAHGLTDYLVLPVFFTVRDYGLIVSGEARYVNLFLGSGHGSVQTYYAFNISKQFPLDELAKLLFGNQVL